MQKLTQIAKPSLKRVWVDETENHSGRFPQDFTFFIDPSAIGWGEGRAATTNVAQQFSCLLDPSFMILQFFSAFVFVWDVKNKPLRRTCSFRSKCHPKVDIHKALAPLR